MSRNLFFQVSTLKRSKYLIAVTCGLTTDEQPKFWHCNEDCLYVQPLEWQSNALPIYLPCPNEIYALNTPEFSQESACWFVSPNIAGSSKLDKWSNIVSLPKRTTFYNSHHCRIHWSPVWHECRHGGVGAGGSDGSYGTQWWLPPCVSPTPGVGATPRRPPRAYCSTCSDLDDTRRLQFTQSKVGSSVLDVSRA